MLGHIFSVKFNLNNLKLQLHKVPLHLGFIDIQIYLPLILFCAFYPFTIVKYFIIIILMSLHLYILDILVESKAGKNWQQNQSQGINMYIEISPKFTSLLGRKYLLLICLILKLLEICFKIHFDTTLLISYQAVLSMFHKPTYFHVLLSCAFNFCDFRIHLNSTELNVRLFISVCIII